MSEQSGVAAGETGEHPDTSPARRGSLVEVLGASMRLGLTSFGGPIAHLGYFREEYCPVRIEARFGEHSGVVWKALRNVAPSAARRSMCGVFMYGWPEAPVSSKRRSSIRMTMRFGLAGRMGGMASTLHPYPCRG